MANNVPHLSEKNQMAYALMILEKIPDAVFWVDESRRFVYVNEAACKELGYSKEELLTMSVLDIDPNFTEEEPEQYDELKQKLQEGELTHFQTVHRHRDGHLIPVEIVSTGLKSFEGFNIGISIVRNITDRVKVETELRDTYSRLTVLYKIYAVTYKEKNINNLIRDVADILQKELKFDAIIFYLHEEDLFGISLNYALGIPKEIIQKVQVLPKNFVAIGKAILKGVPQYIKYKEAPEDEAIDMLVKHEFTDGVAFPIMLEKKIIGGIGLMNKNHKLIDTKEQELLEAVCRQLSIIIHNVILFNSLNKELKEHKLTAERLKKLNAELKKSAFTDQLTNAWNRRGFLHNVHIEMERARRYQYSISLLILDIDYFKDINDHYGHQLGDFVLEEFARIIQANIRSFDSLTRWGGEEFLLLAPYLNGNEAFELAERLRILVAQHQFEEAGSVTVSIGVTELSNKDNLDVWIKKVDCALYRAKKLGRNRVELSV
jgi:diguanylate cyclase (GGDEF)-like protein/PAS domain S-box-containing protein